jgi:outer membrane protein TolC
MKAAVEQNEAAVKLAMGGYIPNVSAFGSYQHQEGPAM